LGARRRHVVDAGDRRELLFQRGRHRRGHGVRVRPRERRGDLDGREIHVREVADRQDSVAHDAEEQDPRHDERGHHRPANEDLGHAPAFGDGAGLGAVAGAPGAGLISTRAPGTSRSWPSVTTRSPDWTPRSRTASGPWVTRSVTGRTSTVLSGFTTNTYCPFWPV